jgi:carboxyl-terminal processing protease
VNPRLRSFLTSTFLVFSLTAILSAAPDRELKTTPLMRLETRTLVQMLEHFHYNKDGVSPTEYADIVTRYMEELDPQRLFFLQTDEQAFRRQYGPRLETDLAYLGNIDAAFDIYKVYEQRVQARISWIFEQLPGSFEFTADESYTPDRSKSPFPASAADADDLWRKRLKYEMLHDVVAKKTVDEAKTTLRKRYERMLKNMGDTETSDIQETFLTSLTRMYDPHSDYFSADTYQDFSIQMKLSLVGIGAVLGIEEDGYCIVREVVAGGPAFTSGQIKVNDKIVAVQQEGAEPIEVIGMKLRRIVDMIRGAKGTKVTLTVLPRDASDASQTKQVHIVRDVIKLNSARASATIYELPGANTGETIPVGVIALHSFYDGSPEDAAPEDVRNTASQDVAELVAKLKTEGIKALVIDLRRNGGGLLTEAVNLTGLFIKTGPVVQERDFQGQVSVDSDTDSNIAYDGPLAVLTSRFSASASEIFAGALQNYGRAVIIGDSSTHGKGTVQAVLEMKNFLPRLSQDVGNTGAAKLTVRKFYLPNGASTQKKGVTPDITLPSIDDFLPIGEGTLPRALVWDEISPSAFTGKALDQTFVQPLLEASRGRQDSLEEFVYLKKNIDWFREKQEQKTVSLNLDQRLATKQADEEFKKAMKAEAERLAQNNYVSREIKLDSVIKAEAAGLAPAPNLDEGDTDAEEDDARAKFDVHLRETLRVVGDALRLDSGSLISAETPSPVALHKG